MELQLQHKPAAHCENGTISNLLRYTFPGLLFKRITKLFGIKSEMRRFLSKDRAMKKLDEVLLGQKTPVGLVVVYSVLDPVTIEKVTLSTKDLKKVRFTKGTYPLMGQMYWIKQMPEVIPDLKPLILKAIKKNCKHMAFQPKFIPFAGTNGIIYLSKKIRTWEKTMGRKKALLNLAQIIRMLEETGTGGAGFRYVYGAFLQEAAEKTGLDFMNNYSAEMTQIGDKWREFSYQSSKMLKKRNDEGLTFDDLGDMLEKLGETERDFFRRLYVDIDRCSE